MINPYNILYPFRYDAIKSDSTVNIASRIIEYGETMILFNHANLKNGICMLPVFIKDVSDSEYDFFDAYGKRIDTKILKVDYGNGWVDVNSSGPFSNDDEYYQHKNSTFFSVIEHKDVMVGLTISGDAIKDADVFERDNISRLEYLYRIKCGCTSVESDETISTINTDTGEVVTDIATHIVNYPLSIQYEEGDVIPAEDFIDKPVSLSISDGYVKISIKKEYEHLKSLFYIDANNKLELV